MVRVFIDGREGTTGLRIAERLADRADISRIALPEALRKDVNARKEALNACDAAILCLPDAAAIEAAALVENPEVTILDASSAHRTHPGWLYGMPELIGAEAIRGSKRISVPGCHASGFVLLIAPLMEAGLLSKDALLSCHSLTGYSGGGKKMIADYAEKGHAAPRAYALSQMHKHLPEMAAATGLRNAPAFLPVVGNFYSGMLLSVPLHRSQLAGNIDDLRALYAGKYAGPVVQYKESLTGDGFLSAAALAGSDGMWISVAGEGERMQLLALYDNLGKGASGAAVQLLNIKMGAEMTSGLTI